MPTMTFNRKDLCKLVGKEFTVEQLAEKMPMIGVAWEGATGDEIEIEAFPNRPDMLSVEGLARAFAAFADVDTGMPEYPVLDGSYKVHVDKAVTNVRPYIACAVVKGAKLDDATIKSLLQLQEKLHASHCRRRAKASIGVYDLDKIKFPVKYTTAAPDINFIPLGWDTPHTLAAVLEKHPRGIEFGWIIKSCECYPVLADAKDMLLSMPPIINSKDAAMTVSTKNLFIDVTGTDQRTVKEVLNIVVTALADRGGKIHSVAIEYPKLTETTPELSPKLMKLDLNYVNKLLGIKLDMSNAVDLLKHMRFDAVEFLDSKEGVIEATVPAYRTDIMHPIDLVEDIAIAYGYQNFKPVLPPLFTIGEESVAEEFSRKLVGIMSGLGFQETLTYILSNNTKQFSNMNIKELPTVKTINPRTIEFTSVRTWILPSLLEALAANQHNLFPQKLAEVGDCLELDESKDTGTRTVRRLAAVICHDAANLTECKSVLESVLKNLGLEFEIVAGEHPSFVPSRFGNILINGESAGFFGEIHPDVLYRWKLEKPVIAFELDVETLQPAK